MRVALAIALLSVSFASIAATDREVIQQIYNIAGAQLVVPVTPPVEPPVIPPVTPPTQPPAGCNANAIQPALAWGEVRQQRAASGQVMAFPVAGPQTWHASVAFTQGQQPSTAAGTITEYTVSRCPGAIDTTAGLCYYRGPFVNNNGMDIYTRDVGVAGCQAPITSGPWYINVRWTYSSCPSGSCGFSIQWADGPW